MSSVVFTLAKCAGAGKGLTGSASRYGQADWAAAA